MNAGLSSDPASLTPQAVRHLPAVMPWVKPRGCSSRNRAMAETAADKLAMIVAKLLFLP